MTQPPSRAAAAPGRRVLGEWLLCSTAPGHHAQPRDIDTAEDAQWVAAPVGTVAAMLRAAGQWSLDGAPRRFDAEDWWFRTSFDVSSDEPLPAILGLDGLAGLADVWVNGHHVLHSENMHVASVCPVQHLLRVGSNAVHLRFAALDAALVPRRARPRWRAPMIEHQQLRWFRQTPIGRTPGWTPPAAAVGPWRDVWLGSARDAAPGGVEVRASLGADGSGRVHVVVTCDAESAPAERVEFELAREGRVLGVDLQSSPSGPSRWEGQLRVDAPTLWWPHTHGEPALYGACARIWPSGGARPRVLPTGAVGFRTVAVDHADGDFALSVNGVSVFCRGACWMPLDVVSLRSTGEGYRDAIAQARDAGMNMLRVSGATVYEDEAFFAACDEHGVLVWQDFMFSNMDYPADDAAFMESVRTEATQQLTRWRGHPCVAVVCGNSEVEQQAAMWGAPRELWSPPLFHDALRRWTSELLPEVPYWPSSAHGGAFPHQCDVGTSSYYGVGAYLRPQDDARRAQVRFTTECLGFSNVPEPETIARMPHGHALRVHHPAWKLRAPRDLGAGWDFEDVRDHYLTALFGVDPMRCRYADHDRYLALSRVVTGELMADAFAEWRRPGSNCRGALVWYLRDFWAGAGWGLIDDTGLPKACWYFLRRALQPLSVSVSDEGGNGLVAHLVNERGGPLDADLRVTLFGNGEVQVARAERRVPVAGRSAVTLPLATLFDGFLDLAYSYRFGPPPATLVHVQWLGAEGQCLAEAFHFPAGRPSATTHDMPLAATFRRLASGGLSLRLDATRFAQTVHLEFDGHAASDNYFHMAPGTTREVLLRPLKGEHHGVVKGWVRPLNSAQALPLRWQA